MVAADGHRALELAPQGSTVPDLIIADYNLPKGLNGIEIIAKLQKQVKRTIPAIVLTGDISTDSLREITRHGCVHLNKPVRAKELTRLAQRLLAKPHSPAPDSVQQLPLSLSTVFVVDDDRAVREAMRDLLQENGYAVELFADGPAFLEAYRLGRVGCLLVDVMMPGMNGVELIERLKAEGHALPTIVITGSGAVPIAVQAMKSRSCGFHREARRPQRAARQRQARSQSDAGHHEAICMSGPGRATHCHTHGASAPSLGPRPRRPSKQEHCR